MYFTSLYLAVLGLVVTAANADDGPLILKRVASFKAWKKQAFTQAPLAGDFVSPFMKPTRSVRPIAQATEVRAAFLPGGTGFAICCSESDPSKIVALYGPEHRDRNLPSKDDCVEILIDPNRDGDKAFGIAVNTKGAVLDAIYYPRGYVDPSWDSGVKPEVSVNARDWTVVLEVPFTSLGMKLSAGDTIGLAFNRVRQADGKNGQSVWPRRKCFWTWRQRRQIPDPFFFAAAVLEPPAAGLSFISTTRGSLYPSGPPQENGFAGFFRNRGNAKREYRFDASLKTNGREEIFFRSSGSIGAGEVQPVHTLYPAGKGPVEFTAWDKASGERVYQSAANRTFGIPSRIHDLGGTYEDALTETRADAPSRDGYFICPLHIDRKLNVWMAQSMAFETSHDSLLDEMAKTRQLPYTTISDTYRYNRLKTVGEDFRKRGIKVVFYPDWFRFPGPGGYPKSSFLVNVSSNPESKSRWHYKILPTEKAKAAYFRSLEEGLKEYGELIWGVVVTDELDHFFSKGIQAAFASDQMRKRFGRWSYGEKPTGPATCAFISMIVPKARNSSLSNLMSGAGVRMRTESRWTGEATPQFKGLQELRIGDVLQ